MNVHKKKFEELKEISLKLASIARSNVVYNNSGIDYYNECIKKMFDIGCFSNESIFDKEIFIDDLR